MSTAKTIQPPTRRQHFFLRLMIMIGLCTIFFFLYTLSRHEVRGDRWLYGLLMATFVYTCFKVIYEWYHYWDITVPENPSSHRPYTVDIFTTFCPGEPYTMIVSTLKAIQAIHYPHNTYLCDEANDPYLKDICTQLGVHHITRTDRKNAKAGNINNALQQSSGELCVVLDPDHVPHPNFLDNIIPHFSNVAVGYVQVVQAYSNHHISWIAKGAAQQTYQFYGPMMMTMNAYGTAQAIGANCTFRRTALESIGGHAAGLAEDMHTSMQLHAKGWQSVYVPEVVTQGLVPETLSAYFKQQLKWSRGVFELWVTSYVKLFRQFSWRQKLHYGMVPMFYFSGFIFLINFIIPVISLLTEVYPMQMDFGAFFLVSFPFITSVVLIRLYVQRWVMQDNERGFHIGGGILLIGTWWVFITGFIYTVIRKKVPYIPTPKDDSEDGNWIINAPNIFILLVSLAAIVYGLYNDWTPYNLIMAGIAFVNCLFMAVNILASQQLRFKRYANNRKGLSVILQHTSQLKGRFWMFRRRLYSGMRSICFMLVVASVCFSFYQINYASSVVKNKPRVHKTDIFLSGIFYPGNANGLTNIQNVQAYQQANYKRFDILSFYIPWGSEPQCFIDDKLMQATYQNQSIPMITWEPWQTLFKRTGGEQVARADQKVFKNICNGEFDAYIKTIALQLKTLQRPVFLRFAHEADNPQYPWSARGGNTPAEFKAAWNYVRKIFADNHAYNVIWVWNPWKAAAAQQYFPGKNEVDWIGITGLSFGRYNTDHRTYSFAQLYQPFHRLPLMRQGLPVIIAEMGSLPGAGDQQQWLKDAFHSFKTTFPEVRGFVLFNSSFDKNTPDGSARQLDWRLNNIKGLDAAFSHPPAAIPLIKLSTIQPDIKHLSSVNATIGNVKGIIYAKHRYWYNNRLPLTKKIIEADFAKMKTAGINTVNIYGPNIYDHTLLEVADRRHMKLIYTFWVPDVADMSLNDEALNKLAKSILKTVEQNADNQNIIAWNIGNNTLQQIADYYYKPVLYAQQQKYLNWLSALVRSIKLAGSHKLITADVAASPTLAETLYLLQSHAHQIDAYSIHSAGYSIKNFKIAGVPYYWGNIRPSDYLQYGMGHGAVAGFWQDQKTNTLTTFNGLNDAWGRNKPELFKLSQAWHGRVPTNNLPAVKILRPALTTDADAKLPYHAMVYLYNKWNLAGYLPTGLEFEWYMVNIDDWGNTTSMNLVAKGADVKITMPKDAPHHLLYLIGSKGNNCVTTLSAPNLPLYYSQNFKHGQK